MPTRRSAATASRASGRSASTSVSQPTSVAAAGDADDRLSRRLDARRSAGVDRERRTRRGTRASRAESALRRSLAADAASRVHADVRSTGAIKPSASARSTIARASGCVAPCSRLSASSQHLVLGVTRRRGCTPATLGRALRQRARLVDDERVDPLGALERRRVLDQDAGAARRDPTPTISAVGVASPSAHGQAITSTAVARISAAAQSPVTSSRSRRR